MTNWCFCPAFKCLLNPVPMISWLVSNGVYIVDWAESFAFYNEESYHVLLKYSCKNILPNVFSKNMLPHFLVKYLCKHILQTSSRIRSARLESSLVFFGLVWSCVVWLTNEKLTGWLVRMWYLISLNPLLSKNIAYMLCLLGTLSLSLSLSSSGHWLSWTKVHFGLCALT